MLLWINMNKLKSDSQLVMTDCQLSWIEGKCLHRFEC